MADLSKSCTQCKNQHHCAYLHPYIGFYCPGMELIIDNSPARKEPLVSDIYQEEVLAEDYKNALNRYARDWEIRRDKNYRKIADMPDKDISDLRLKAVAAMTFFKIDPKWIMLLLHISRGTFYRMIKK